MKKICNILIVYAVLGTVGITSYADTIIDAPTLSDGDNKGAAVTAAPPDLKEDVAIDIGKAETIIVSVPGSLPDPPNVSGKGSGSSSGSSNAIIAGPGAGGSYEPQVPGSKYADSAKTKVELGFTLISPNYDFNGFKVAEGCVQLNDGSRVIIPHDKYIRQPYYKLLREDGDWYVVSVHANRIGNYITDDGSYVDELRLKKSDFIARSYIELNTGNSARHAVVKYALELLGKGYKYGGNGPDNFDCSGFVNKVMSQNGINIARSSTEICSAGSEVGITGLRPGDITGRPGHVGIYIGGGYFVHAAESSTGVITDSLDIYNRSAEFTSYRNVIGD